MGSSQTSRRGKVMDKLEGEDISKLGRGIKDKLEGKGHG